MRFSVLTLGCKTNQYDTGTIADILHEHGFLRVKPGDGSDVCIVNTCAVTAESVRKSKQAVRRIKRLEPYALIAVCGCFSELDNSAAAQLEADIIGGARDREEFANKIVKAVSSKTSLQKSNTLEQSQKDCTQTQKGRTQTPKGRTRPLIKIQDGCDNNCAYCIIPALRGHSRSVSPKELAKRAKKLQESGCKEIIITGIEISSYKFGSPLPSEPLGEGSDQKDAYDLIDAVRVISTAAPGARLRLGSLDPRILTDGFIKRLAEIPSLCNHFHISLQSGCDETLKEMGRGYTTSHVYNAIVKLAKTFSNCAVTADLIVGFPGETDAQFEKTLDFIIKAGFARIHIFPYSPRPGTKAAGMKSQIEKTVIRQRAKIAGETAARLADKYRRAQIGMTLAVLFEQQKGNCAIGHASNYMKVAVHGKITKNTIENIEISSIKDDMLFGKIV